MRYASTFAWGALIAAAIVVSPGFVSLARPADDDEEGFVSLFDGKSLTGWQGATDGYKVEEEGVRTCRPDGGGFLYTDKEDGDFV